MANRFYSPNQQFADTTGAPYAGGSLAFYASGTSTPLATYSDSALTIANTNPVTLDSAGRAGNIFLQNLAYKVVLSDVNSNVIWTDDPVYSSDYSARAKLTTGLGSPNGSVAGTAGSSGIGADTYWDATNNILYVCTTTGSAASAVWTAVNASTAASVVPPPQGYLTLASGTPVITSDVIGTTIVYYTPYVGNTVPVYNGSSFNPTVFSELLLTLTASQAANTIYDVFVFNNSGVLTLATGPAWATSTAGSSARGTGASTTQLSRLNGIYVNTVQISGKNSSNTYTIAANQGTYLGSIFIDGTAGQTTCHLTIGQNRKWGVWNAYNRVPIRLLASDPTANWVYASSTVHASNGAPAAYSATAFNVGSGTVCNGGVAFQGLPEEDYNFSFNQRVSISVNNGGGNPNNLIGINSITAGSGRFGSGGGVQSGVGSMVDDLVASFSMVPTLGLTNFCCLESTNYGATYFGSATFMVMAASWRG